MGGWDWSLSSGGGKTKYMKNCNRETSLRSVCWKARIRGEDNIKIDLKEVCCKDVN